VLEPNWTDMHTRRVSKYQKLAVVFLWMTANMLHINVIVKQSNVIVKQDDSRD